MKKIIALVVLGLGFTFSVNAQSDQKKNQQVTVKLSPETAAENDAEAIANLLDFNDEKKQDFKRLFIMKYEMFQDKKVSIEKKKEFSTIVEAKIAASIDGNQLAKLKAKTDLYKQITIGNSIE